jgi:type I restriction enzyme R subunit
LLQRLPADGDARDRFAGEFTGIQTLWEFLHPHEVLDEHTADYKWLAQVNEGIKPTQVSNAPPWDRLGDKTLALVHGHMSKVEVTGTGLEEVIVDPDSIKALRALIEQGGLDLDPDGGLRENPVTLDEMLNTIDARIRRRLETPTTPSIGPWPNRSSDCVPERSGGLKTRSSASNKYWSFDRHMKWVEAMP